MAQKGSVSSGTAGKPIKCRAAVARAAGEPLVIEEVIVAPPKAHEVRIRIICTSLCLSDVTFWRLTELTLDATVFGSLKVPPACFPRILGHEAVGYLWGEVHIDPELNFFEVPPGSHVGSEVNRFWVVESIGEDVHELTTGDMVIPIFLPDCAECTDCKSKKSNLCSKFPFQVSSVMPRDGTTRFTDLKGETLFHFLWISSFSEYTVVDVASVTKIDPTIPPNRACLLSCGVSTGVGAAWRTANVKAGSTVAIFGLGSIGLAVAEGARLCGATRIVGVDINPDKFEIARKFGVTEFVNSNSCGDKSVSQVINEITEGGADYCFECVGMASLVQEAYACCRKGWGKTIVVGVDKPGSQVTFSSFDVLHLGKSLMGSLYGGLKPKTDIPILIKRYMDKELDLDKFVTHEVNLEDINKAFDLLIEGKSLRCVIWMDKDK